MGLNVGDTFNSMTTSLDTAGAAMQKSIENATTGELSNGEMMALQFELGQFNAKQEMMSSILKSLLDTLKSMAQRVG